MMKFEKRSTELYNLFEHEDMDAQLKHKRKTTRKLIVNRAVNNSIDFTDKAFGKYKWLTVAICSLVSVLTFAMLGYFSVAIYMAAFQTVALSLVPLQHLAKSLDAQFKLGKASKVKEIEASRIAFKRNAFLLEKLKIVFTEEEYDRFFKQFETSSLSLETWWTKNGYQKSGDTLNDLDCYPSNLSVWFENDCPMEELPLNRALYSHREFVNGEVKMVQHG